MKKSILTVVLCLIVIGLVVFSLSGREEHTRTHENLLADISAEAPLMNIDLLSEKSDVYNDLSLSLLRTCHSEDNTLLSPLSTVYGLAMTANGAGSKTLSQLEELFGMSASEMNEYLYSYCTRLQRSGETLTAANSLWLSENDPFTVSRDFLRVSATWYDADIYKTEFDNAALEAMSAWTLENTGNSMGSLIQSFRQPEGMILLNTLLFDAYWETPFSEAANREGVFTREDKTEESAIYMTSMEDIYLENENCTGFLKSYRSDHYVFAAILPRENVTIEDFLSIFDGQSLSQLVNSSCAATVHVTMPKFTSGTALDIIPALKNLGVTDVFDVNAADLTGIAADHLHITDILLETQITVDELGTRAVAAAAEAAFPASAREILEEKYVDLNRPFVYMILETTNYTPVFLGTLMTTE